MSVNILTAERLKEVVDYSPKTGRFFWKDATRTSFNGLRAGAKKPNSAGYLIIRIDRKMYQQHRLAWFYVHGQWPAKEQIDHINRDKTDNRIVNLREAERWENQANAGTRIDNVSGFRGVYWSPFRKKWVARINNKLKPIHLGFFTTAEAAHVAYANHSRVLCGEFSRDSY